MAKQSISAKQGAARKRVTILGLSTAPLLLSGGLIWAQDAGGIRATFDVSQRLEYIEEDGFTAGSDEGLRSVTGLGFALSSETRGQRLTFSGSTNIAQNLTNGGGTEFEGTLVALDYARFSRNSELTFGATYRRDEVDDLAFDTDLLLDDDITTGTGQREVFGVTTGLTLGREGPITTTLTHAYEKSVYSDTTDPSLTDSDTQSVTGRLSFQVSPVLTTDIFASWREVDEDGATATDRSFTRLGVGAVYAISPATNFTGELFYEEEDSRSTGSVTETDGIGYALGLTTARPNGEISVSFEEEETLNGKRRQALIGRSYELRRGSLSFSVGATKTDGFSAQPLANLSLDFALDPLSTIRVELDQAASVNDDDSEVVNTRLDMSYTRSLSSLSEISAGIALVDENVLGAATGDEQSVRFDLSHRYEITRDWDLVSGFEYSSVDEDGSARRERSTLFLGIERSFDIRP